MAKKKTDNKEPEKLSFEEAIEALSSIVREIETGQTPLQESLKQYEKGMALIAYCRGILEGAEKKIEEIDAQNAGRPRNAAEVEGEEDVEDEGDGGEEGAGEEEEGLF